MPKNIFDLTKGGSKKKTSNKYKKDEVKDLLVGYINIQPNQWGDLDKGTHIRYIRTNGKFVRGGFVVGYTNIGEDRALNIENGFNAASPGYAFWTIRLNLIKALFAKEKAPDKPQPERPLINTFSLTSNAEVIEWMNKATKTINALSKRVEALENKN